MKKRYKPKQENVQKMTAFYKKIKGVNQVQFNLIKKVTKILLIVGLFSSCSAQWHLKKAVRKNPDLLKPQSVLIDTIITTDSVVSRDTFISNVIDTMVIENEKFRTVVLRSYDTLRVETILKPDTIRITKTIELPAQIVYKKSYHWVIVTLIGLVFLCFRFIRK